MNCNRNFSFLVILLIGLSNFSILANAEDDHPHDHGLGEMPVYAGMLLGPGFVNGGRGTKFSYGARLGVEADPQVSVGAYYNRFNVVSSYGGGSSANFILGEANFFPKRCGEGFFIGGKLGVGIISSNVYGNSDTDTNFALSPAGGFEKAISSNRQFILGLETNYTFLTSSNGLAVYNLLGTFKVVFDPIF